VTLLDRRHETEEERRARALEAERFAGRCAIHGRKWVDLCELCRDAREDAS
jgi:hypothetical protein